LSVTQRLTPPFLTLVSVPTWLTGSRRSHDPQLHERRLLNNPEKATYILDSLLRRLQKALKQVSPRAGHKTRWSDYASGGSPYTADQADAKRGFVDRVLNTCSPRRILDIGCNTGTFSMMGAHAGASVVAIDADPVVVGELWRSASDARLDILALVVDVTRPSPAIGWDNNECSSFLQRARGAFDVVLLLAVVHHMLVTERVPLDAIVDLAADLTTDVVIVEFIAPTDSMFRRLTRGRDALFETLTERSFEDACRRRFEIASSYPVPGVDRRLYFLRKKP
jgi:2-polyprenyl-3-methyl-5-hydroxy-6-metoxy-1,4-benzoquinol methylase